MKWMNDPFGDFKCVNCRTIISADPFLSGVHNRNHCPYCLWSRHMDLHRAGDRLCACKSAMRPVALTLKKTNKKYGSAVQGELMLVHRCTGCGQISINRIAADDVPETILEIFYTSLQLEPGLRASICQNGIQPLEQNDLEVVRARLFGWGAALAAAGQHSPSLAG